MGTNANEKVVYNALRARGYSAAAASGAVGNLMQESNVTPGPAGNQVGGAGRGIAQWGTGPGSGGRWETENAYARAHNQNPWALNTQIGFLAQEMSQRGIGPGSSFAKGSNVTTSAQTFQTVIEQSADLWPYTNRVNYAQQAFNAWSGNPVTSAPAKATTAPRAFSSVPGIHAGPSTSTPPPKGKATTSHPAGKGAPQNPIGAALGSAGNFLAGIPGDIGSAAGSAASGVGSAAQAITSPAQAVAKVTTTIFSVSFWIRVAFIVVGLALVFIGTKALLTGSPPQMPMTTKTPAPANTGPAKKSFGKRVAGTVEDTGAVAA